MKLYINIFILLIFLTACNSNTSNQQAAEQIKPERIEFPLFNSQFSQKTQMTVEDKLDGKYNLDSIFYVKWSDKYSPYSSPNGRMYSAYLYSVQPQLDKFAVLAIRTDADHWNKIHLITINEHLEMVDRTEISDSWADLLEQAGDTEIVGKQSMYTNMVSDTEYQNIDIRTTEVINYYTDSTTYEVDSVVTKIKLQNNGTFKLTKLDSVRTVKYSEIE